MSEIYHIAQRHDWLEAQASGEYAISSLHKTFQDDGFIHCSQLPQILPIANRIYASEPDLVILVIDTERVSAHIKYENLIGGVELYPHVYGKLHPDDVVEVVDFGARDERGDYVLPPELTD